MAGSEEIGKVKYTVEADISGLKGDIAEAKTEVESMGDAGEAAGDRTKESMDGASASVEGLAGSLGKAVGILGAVTAAIGGVVKAYQSIADYIRNGETVAELFLVEQDTVNSTESSLNNINTKIIEVGAELERVNRNPLSIFGRRKGQIEEELESLRRRQLSASRQLRAQRVRDAKQDAKESVDAFNRQLEQSNEADLISLLPDRERIRANAEMQIEALVEAAAKAGEITDRSEIRRRIEIIDQIAQKEIDKINEQERIKDEAQAKRDKESAARQLEAARRSAEAFADALNGSTSNTTTLLNTIVADLRNLTSVSGRR